MRMMSEFKEFKKGDRVLVKIYDPPRTARIAADSPRWRDWATVVFDGNKSTHRSSIHKDFIFVLGISS